MLCTEYGIHRNMRAHAHAALVCTRLDLDARRTRSMSIIIIHPCMHNYRNGPKLLLIAHIHNSFNIYYDYYYCLGLSLG